MAACRLALHQLVEANSEHPGNDFEEADPPAAFPFAKVGGEGLRLLARRSAAPIVFGDERGREAFLRFAAWDVAGERLARDHRGDNAAFRMDPLEGLDLHVDPFRLGGVR